MLAVAAPGHWLSAASRSPQPNRSLLCCAAAWLRGCPLSSREHPAVLGQPAHRLMPGLVSSAVFEEPEDPSNRSFFSEIISSISDVKFSHSGRYIMTRDYLTVKVWDLNMENRPIETYQVSVAQPGTCSSWAPTVLLPKPCSRAGGRGDGYKLDGWGRHAVKSQKANEELLNVGSSGLVNCKPYPQVGCR